MRDKSNGLGHLEITVFTSLDLRIQLPSLQLDMRLPINEAAK